MPWKKQVQVSLIQKVPPIQEELKFIVEETVERQVQRRPGGVDLHVRAAPLHRCPRRFAGASLCLWRCRGGGG